MRHALDALVGTGRLSYHGHLIAKVLYTIDRRTATQIVEMPTFGVQELPSHVTVTGLLAVTAGPHQLPVGQPCELILDDGERLPVVLQPRRALPSGEYRVASPPPHLPARTPPPAAPGLGSSA